MPIHIKRCARCDGEHELEFTEMSGDPIRTPDGTYTHWAMCPTTNQPILMARDAKIEPLYDEIRSILNKHSRENRSNTPDFILANFLMDCLSSFELSVNERERWHGK